jgi:hypothetical protein
LCLLATAAVVVSFTAQYRLIQATRRLAVVAGLEAAISDAAALVFARLGIALAIPAGTVRITNRVGAPSRTPYAYRSWTV